MKQWGNKTKNGGVEEVLGVWWQPSNKVMRGKKVTKQCEVAQGNKVTKSKKKQKQQKTMKGNEATKEKQQNNEK